MSKQTAEEIERDARLYAANPEARGQLARARKMSAPAIAVATTHKEVEKPDGGGKGPEALYVVTVEIDGEAAFVLRRDHFKKAGQMARFVEIVQTFNREFPDAGKQP